MNDSNNTVILDFIEEVDRGGSKSKTDLVVDSKY